MTFDLVEHIRRHDFKRLLLAVSGGLDSICLAHYFIENRKVFGIEWLGIAHVHHGLREGTADRDAKFVEEFAKSHDVPFFLKRLDGETLKSAEGSLEENARDARYKALIEIALDPSTSPQDDDKGAIVTAHHANDQAETMLMRLKRGTTLAGLRGIQEVRVLSNSQGVTGLASEAPLEGVMKDRSTGCNQGESSPTQDDKTSLDPSTTNLRFSAQDDTSLVSRLWTQASLLSQPFGSAMPNFVGRVARPIWLSSLVYLYRPFLNVTRAELLDYARKNRLNWCEDESNADVKFARNKIRHEILPQLESECPGVTKQLCRIAELADKAYAKVMEKCKNVFAPCLLSEKLWIPSLRSRMTIVEDDISLVSSFDKLRTGYSSFISLDKKKLNKILREHAKADLSELFRLWLSELGFRFPTGFFYAPKEPAHVKIPVRAVYRKRSVVKKRNTVWICEFKDTESASKFVSCEMKEKDYNE